jgi:hypothetical protein
MRLPTFTPKRTVRTVIDLETPADGLTLPLAVLREIVAQTSEFGDEATAEFHIRHGYVGYGSSYSRSTLDHPAFRSLVVEEVR